jgi:RNA polymerase sigma-70 factor (ECF subfamily)
MMGELKLPRTPPSAFISAYRKLGSYRGGSFKAWLLRIVTNLCYDELRRRKRRPTTPLEPVDNEEEEIESPRGYRSNGTPEDETEHRQAGRAATLSGSITP